jgi:predicted  nucleic acid-binding Zn-ribbon protein
VPIQEDIIDLQSDADITKKSIRTIEGEIVDLGNGLTTLEIITGRISTHVEDLESNFSDFVQTSEGFFYRVGDLENNVGQL